MTLGSAIFWSTVLVLAALAARTVSRAGKGRVVRRVVAAVVGLCIVAALGVWGWFRYQERPVVMEELAGIRLDMKPVEVKLLRGNPSDSVNDGKASMHWVFRESYSNSSLDVFFDSLGVFGVCETGGYSKLFGLGNYSAESDVIDKLGQPTSTSIRDDGLSKIISYKPWNVAFEVSKGVVKMVCVSSGSFGYSREYQ